MPNRPTTGRASQEPSGAGDRILRLVHRYRYVSNAQLCRAAYAKDSLDWVQKNTKKLASDGYLERIYLPRMKPGGSSPSVYTLARPGMQYLAAAHGFPLPPRARRSVVQEY